MLCLRCQSNKTSEKLLNLGHYNIKGKVYRIDCDKCSTFVAVKLDDKIIDVNSICCDQSMNGWIEVRTNREIVIYYVLCRIIYLEFDTPLPNKLESPFDVADESDIIIVRWIHGKPIGFYTVKPKGTEILSTKETYTMCVLDTAYIRSEYRGKGYGYEMIHDITKRFPDQDIGFSKPISHGMLKVLRNFLLKKKEYRLRFWEVADCDLHGSLQLLWYRLRKL